MKSNIEAYLNYFTWLYFGQMKTWIWTVLQPFVCQLFRDCWCGATGIQQVRYWRLIEVCVRRALKVAAVPDLWACLSPPGTLPAVSSTAPRWRSPRATPPPAWSCCPAEWRALIPGSSHRWTWWYIEYGVSLMGRWHVLIIHILSEQCLLDS